MRFLYRFLLRLFLPRSLRDTHGAEMEQLFVEQVGEARGRGLPAAVRSALGGMSDVATRAPREHWNRSGPVHSQNKEHPVQSFLIDLRQTFRSFARRPAATAAVVATLTLAVAANTTVFALLDATFRRSFPFPNAERMVSLNEKAPKWNLTFTNINYPDFVAWREKAKAFESMALYEGGSANLADANGAERLRVLRVTHDFATVLQVPLERGRMFSDSEDVPHGPNVVVIGHALWKSRFAGALDVVGKELRIDGAPHTIIGVFPPQANFPSDVAMWLPLRGNPQQQGESYSSDGIGRLKAGVTLTQAEQSLLDAHASIWATKDTSHTVSPRVDDLRERFVGDFAIAGKALAISAAFVLLIACANVCGTMLARSIARRKEITVRVALGASASRVVRQLLTESLTLSIVAGVFGTALAQFALFSLLRTNSDLLPVWARPSVDVSSVLFAVSIVATTTLLFGLAPALQLRRHVRNDAASSASRVAGSVPERRVLNILVCTEVALAAVLLVSGGLLFRTYQSMREVKPGFRTEGVATFRVSLPQFTYPNGSAQLQLYNRLLTRLVAIPGVDHVGGVSCLPFSCHLGNFFRAENAPPPKQDASNPVMLLRVASPDYFVTMGITLRSGRFFRDGEGGAAGATRVAVVNQQFADRLWPDANPIGRRFEFSGDTPNQWVTVVGVVNDVRHYGLAKPMTEGLYLSTTSIDSTSGWRSLGFAVHTKNSADDILPALRAAVHDVDSELPVFELQTMSASLERSMSKQRLMAFALMVFATVAVALAVGGIYAVLSYVVGQRRREIAIRMALGARSEQVLLLVMKQGMRLVVIGLIIGVPIAMGVSRAMSSLLIGISARDPMIFFLATLLLTGVGALAAMIPALRASHLEPKSVLAENA